MQKRIDSEHQAARPLRREEPQPVRHPRDRGRDADPRGRQGPGRRDRLGDDGPRVRRAGPPQGRCARRRPLDPPHGRGPCRVRRLRHGIRACEGARVRAAGPGAARPAVGRRRVLHDRRGRRGPPEDAVADAGDQDRGRRRQAGLRAPGRVRVRHGRGRAPGGDLRRRRDQRAPVPEPEGDHGREEEAARDLRRRPTSGSRPARSARPARRRRCWRSTRRPRRRPARSSRTRTRTRRSRRSSRGSTKGSFSDARDSGLRPPRRRGQLQQELARGDLRGGQARRRAGVRGRRGGRRRRRPTTPAPRSARTAPPRSIAPSPRPRASPSRSST